MAKADLIPRLRETVTMRRLESQEGSFIEVQVPDVGRLLAVLESAEVLANAIAPSLAVLPYAYAPKVQRAYADFQVALAALGSAKEESGDR